MTEFNAPDLLKKKMSGNQLSKDELFYLMKSTADQTLDDTQVGALVTVFYLCGLNTSETAHLTTAMKDSGNSFKWPKDWKVADKHSTGGVGDKVSIPLAPALAACGLKIPMISGRGLGHTGGTVDKIESVPGLSTSLTEEKIEKALITAGCCIVGQTSNIAPADRRMYAARNITGTIDSIPLTTSSIMSKKAAESITALVMDIKYGKGAFMKTVGDAEELGTSLVNLGNAIGIKTTALITTMDTPIGRMIGNALEVQESIECLKGKGPADLRHLVTKLGGELLASTGLTKSAKEGEDEIRKVLDSGEALAKFCQMLQAQGVNKDIAESLCYDDDADYLPKAKNKTSFRAETDGYVFEINAMDIAEATHALGGGRKTLNSVINLAVGIELIKIVGDRIAAGETWAVVHHDDEISPFINQKLKTAITITETEPKINISRILKRIAI